LWSFYSSFGFDFLFFFCFSVSVLRCVGEALEEEDKSNKKKREERDNEEKQHEERLKEVTLWSLVLQTNSGRRGLLSLS
jgi:hypothetical protein